MSFGKGKTYIATVAESPIEGHDYDVTIKQSVITRFISFFQEMIDLHFGDEDAQTTKQKTFDKVANIAIKEYQSRVARPTSQTLSYVIPTPQPQHTLTHSEPRPELKHFPTAPSQSSAYRIQDIQGHSSSAASPQYHNEPKLNETPTFDDAVQDLQKDYSWIDLDSIANHQDVRMSKQLVSQALASSSLRPQEQFTQQEQNAIRLAGHQVMQAELARTFGNMYLTTNPSSVEATSVSLETQLSEVQQVVLSKQDFKNLKAFLNHDNKNMSYALGAFIHHRPDGKLNIDNYRDILKNPTTKPAMVIRECHKFLADKIQESKFQAEIEYAKQLSSPPTDMVDRVSPENRKNYNECMARIEHMIHSRNITRAEFIKKIKQAGFGEGIFAIESRVALKDQPWKTYDSFDPQSKVVRVHANVDKFNTERSALQLKILSETL
ncbi:hypothetical protein [Parashewanella curva]|uniref:hypothetical protein n=1 Tax=Parashewanella curva TaxID=2338552 RepID=UPI00105A2504|nr:hypothetical protein [Parashewanella curva]